MAISIGYRYKNASFKVRPLDKKDFYSVGEISRGGLFGSDRFESGSHKYVTITEGELDALSLYQVVKGPVVSVQSSTSAERDCILDLDWLKSFERVYLAFDADAPGREATRRVARLFDYDKVFIVKFTKRKDANEYLQAGETEELRNIWWNAKRYMPESITSSFAEFETLLGAPVKWGLAYPFPTLTAMTYGIRTGESVLITAQEGIGKTEIMHAIEHKILTETKDNVGAVFLEELPRRHLQALGGIQLRRPVHLPDAGITSDQILRAVQEVVQEDGRLHLYSHFGSMDPTLLLDTIRFLVSARKSRYILLDHVGMVLSGSEGQMDERRGLDFLTTKLETMVKELDFALLMVSHVNDFGQTRGSRYISKICDTRIDLVRDLTSADPIERNTTYINVSKNRYGMKTGPAGRIFFDTSTYTFREIEDDRHPDMQGSRPSNDNVRDSEGARLVA